jgi:hypothetical protein
MKTQGVSMRGIFWNIRGLNHLGRNGQLIRTHRVYFIRVQEIKRKISILVFLKNLTTPSIFQWNFIPANGTAGGS